MTTADAIPGWISRLPALNAVLNAGSAALLAAGYSFIRRKNIGAHKTFMLSAFAVSSVFLISYVTYHARVGDVHFTGTGPVRPVYFSILISHTVLALAVVPLVLITLTYALKSSFEKHKKIAKWTLPVWLYVSITGVIVYWLLYVVFKAHP